MSIIDNITVGTISKNQHDYILLDRSGSMASRWDDTLGGVNSYVKKLASDLATRDILVTVALFDNNEGKTIFDMIRRGVPAKNWEDIMLREASPRGFTPLYDAVGRIVTIAMEDNPEKSAIVIVTDGAENRSTEYNRESAKGLLEQCRKRDWQVLFLGADFENTKQAHDLGNEHRHTMSYGSHNTFEVFASSASTRSMYSKGLADMSFTPVARKRASAPKDDSKK